MARPLISLAALITCSLVGCSTQAGPPAPAAESRSVHPVSGLEVIPLTITQNGKTHRFQVEVAETNEAQYRGLMFRNSLGPDEGMIFPSNPPRFRSFWMHNTVISLDIMFIGADGLVSNIAANTVPYSEAPIPSSGLAIAVLEIRGGRARELGIMPGARVSW